MIVHNLGRKTLGVILFTVAAVALFLILLTKTGVHSPFQKRQNAYIIIPDAYELVPQSDVREAGVLVGDVSSVNYKLTPSGVVSKVGISLNPGHHIYRNATFQLRTKTLANENYIALVPGTPAAGLLPTDGTLSITHSAPAVQLDQVLDTFNAPTRAAAQQEIQEVGSGLNGQGDNLNSLLGASGMLGQRGEVVLGLLNRQHTEVANIVKDTSTVLATFQQRTQAVRTLAVEAQSAAQAASSRDQDIASTLRTLPSALAQIRETVGRLGNFSSTATPVVQNLTSVTEQATPVLADLTPTAAAARVLVQKLPAALRVGKPLLAQLTPFTQKLTPTVSSLAAFLRQADPLLSYLEPYYNEISDFFGTNGGAIGQYDSAGALGRVFPIITEDSFTGLGGAAKTALDQLVALDNTAIQPAPSVNPYPKPGTSGTPQPFSGSYPQLQPLSSSVSSSQKK